MGDTVLDLGKKKQRRTLDKVGGISTVIGAGAVFTGRFKGTENYVVYGTIEGDCDLDGTVVVEEGGVWRGQVKGGNVIIAGDVFGDVIAKIKVELAPSAKVAGSIAGPIVAIAEGAVVEGKIQMTSAAQPVRFVEKRTE